MNDTIGIDISKDTLDAYWLSKRSHKQFANSKAGLSALIRWIRQAEASLLVFEGQTMGLTVSITGCLNRVSQRTAFPLRGSICQRTGD